MGRLLQLITFACLAYSMQAAQDGSGISATLVPNSVSPGDIVELRIEMNRAEYAEFKLDIPAQPHLHRIAVESVPVSFVDGRFIQSEKWLLQADASGTYTIEGGKVLLESGGLVNEFALPGLQLAVIPYPEPDNNTDPVGLPEDKVASPETLNPKLWVALLAVGCALVVIAMRHRRNKTESVELGSSGLLFHIAAELEAGTLSSHVLERLIHENDVDLPAELREQLVQYVYGGKGDKQFIIEELKKEALR